MTAAFASPVLRGVVGRLAAAGGLLRAAALAVAGVAARAGAAVRPVAWFLCRHLVETAGAALLAGLATRFGLVETTGLVSGLVLALTTELLACRVGWPHEFDRYLARPWARWRHRVRRRRPSPSGPCEPGRPRLSHGSE
jgi:hypothetical protein